MTEFRLNNVKLLHKEITDKIDVTDYRRIFCV